MNGFEKILSHCRPIRMMAWRWRFQHSPDAVEIETDARCNRRCTYCPVSINPRRTGRMDGRLFRKIIQGLADMEFDGRLSFHFYNEPLLDHRIIKFISFSRSMLTKARIHLFTNGDLLTPGRIQQLIDAGTGLIRVSLHNRKAKERLHALLQKTPPDTRRKIRLHNYFEGEEPMYNRGGSLSFGENFRLYDYSKGCYWAASVVINYEGKVVLCCNDFHAEYTFGDLSSRSLLEVWRDSKKLRQDIFLGRYTLKICKKCTGVRT